MKQLIKTFKVKNLMRASILLLFLFCANLNANFSGEQNRLVSITIKNEPLKKVFKTITDSLGYVFFYETSEIDLNKKINLVSNKESLSDLLGKLSDNSDLNYQITSNQIVVTKMDVL
jgi:hypothetical protein